MDKAKTLCGRMVVAIESHSEAEAEVLASTKSCESCLRVAHSMTRKGTLAEGTLLHVGVIRSWHMVRPQAVSQ